MCSSNGLLVSHVEQRDVGFPFSREPCKQYSEYTDCIGMDGTADALSLLIGLAPTVPKGQPGRRTCLREPGTQAWLTSCRGRLVEPRRFDHPSVQNLTGSRLGSDCIYDALCKRTRERIQEPQSSPYCCHGKWLREEAWG